MLNLLGVERWMRRASLDLGLDLGTANSSWVVPGNLGGQEPTCLALDRVTGNVLAAGMPALEMWGRTSRGLEVVFPVEGGVLADYDAGEAFLRHSMARVGPRPSVLLTVPADVTTVESRTLAEAAREAGAGAVCLLPQPLLGAIGAGLPVAQGRGSLVVMLGAGISEAVVISTGAIIFSSSRRESGNAHNAVLLEHLRQAHHLQVGPRSLEAAKQALGRGEDRVPVSGRDLISGLPRRVAVRQREFRALLEEEVQKLVELMLAAAEATPPELLGQIMEQGAVLCGGVSQLDGLAVTLGELTGIPCRVAEAPQEACSRGMQALLEDRYLLSTVLAAQGERSLAAV